MRTYCMRAFMYTCIYVRTKVHVNKCFALNKILPFIDMPMD